jgi:hypothetical protein
VRDHDRKRGIIYLLAYLDVVSKNWSVYQSSFDAESKMRTSAQLLRIRVQPSAKCFQSMLAIGRIVVVLLFAGRSLRYDNSAYPCTIAIKTRV